MNNKDRKFIDSLKGIHYMCKFFIEKNNFQFLNRVMEQFGEFSDANEIKTILVITKSFKDNWHIKENRARLVIILNDKLKK